MAYAIDNIAYYDTVDMTSTAYMMADWLVDYNTTDAYNVADISGIGASGDMLFAAFYNWRQGRTVSQCLNDLTMTSYVRSYLSTMVGNVYTMNLSQLMTSYDNTLAAVNTDANLDSTDRVALKMVIAVGYHSAQLWENYFANNGFWRGAITGAIGGAITGSLYEGIIKPSMDNPNSNPSGGYGAGEGTKKPKHRP